MVQAEAERQRLEGLIRRAEEKRARVGVAEVAQRTEESDRLAAIAAGLAANGVQVEEGADSLIVHGNPAGIAGGGVVATHHDHRIAMCFICLGLVSDAAIEIDDSTMINTSFPSFFSLMNQLGAGFATNR